MGADGTGPLAPNRNGHSLGMCAKKTSDTSGGWIFFGFFFDILCFSHVSFSSRLEIT